MLAGVSPPPPSRPCRREFLSQPHSAPLSAPVAYACHGHAPEPSRGQNRPRGCRFGLPRRSAAAEHAAGDVPPPPSPASTLSRRILNQRARLDRGPVLFEPSDLNPTAWIPGYRFGRCLLLKSPPGSEYLTRSPPPLKTNCSLALFYSRTPLSFTRFEPAVHPWRFCTLDPGTNV